jgi:hypothetical protein
VLILLNVDKWGGDCALILAERFWCAVAVK